MTTVTLSVPETQVIELVKRLSPAGKRAILETLIPELDRFEALVDYGAERMRILCAKRGIDWNRLPEEEREHLVDKLLHTGALLS
jgi:hypothetical protein